MHKWRLIYTVSVFDLKICISGGLDVHVHASVKLYSFHTSFTVHSDWTKIINCNLVATVPFIEECNRSAEEMKYQELRCKHLWVLKYMFFDTGCYHINTHFYYQYIIYIINFKFHSIMFSFHIYKNKLNDDNLSNVL
jgi:hypothetical protein